MLNTWRVWEDFVTLGLRLAWGAQAVASQQSRIAESDFYEALAFSLATRCPQVVLLYPAVAREAAPGEVGTVTLFERVTVGAVSVVGVEVEVRGISREGGLRRFAQRLGAGLAPLVSAAAS